MVNIIRLGKKLNSGQPWLTSMGGDVNVSPKKRKIP